MTDHENPNDIVTNSDDTDVQAIYEKYKYLIDSQEKLPEGEEYTGPSLEDLHKENLKQKWIEEHGTEEGFEEFINPPPVINMGDIDISEDPVIEIPPENYETEEN